MPKLISVVIPTYNRASYIGEAVASVLAQTYQTLEVVVVDDGSSDNTAGIIGAISDLRVRYLPQENRGVSAALNTGWRAAKGEYVAIIGSDDRWLPNLLQELVPVLDQDSGVGVAFGRARGIDAQGEPLPQLSGTAERYPGETLKSLVYGDFICPTAVVIRCSALEQVGGYDETLIANEDWDLWIRLAQNWKIVYVPLVLTEYRYHAQNLTRSTSDRMERVMLDRIRVLDKFFAQPNVPHGAMSVKALGYRNVHLDWMIRYIERRDWRKAWREFKQAAQLSPSPLLFVPRALAIAGYYLVLSKTRLGVWLVDQAVIWKRKNSGML